MQSSDTAMRIVLKLPGELYNAAVEPYRTWLHPYVARMQHATDSGNLLATMPVFRDYVTYCRWPIRQLEYSYVLDNLPAEINGRALDVGAGVTPWPYLLAQRGWPTTSVDPEVDQVAAMQRDGETVFGTRVDARVADARGFGFGTGTFALVTCVSVLEHLLHADVPLALAEMVRVCRPGGRIVLTTDVYASDDPTIPVGSGAFSASMLEQIFGPLARGTGAADEFAALVSNVGTLTLADLEQFWVQHWQVGLWNERNRGYGAVGMVFDLPGSAVACAAIARELQHVAEELAYPPAGEPLQRVQTPTGETFWLVNDEVMAREISSGMFEQDLHDFFTRYIRPGDVVFDIGANVGLYTRLFAQLVGANGVVHAFEPTSQIFGCLVRNLIAAPASMRLNRMGLSQENGALPLFLGNAGNACFNSFGEPIAAGALESANYARELAWVTTLDAYMRDYAVPQVDLLKIDVEGWEERVLRGGVATLLEHAPVCVLEFCSPAARNSNSSCAHMAGLLGALGYRLFRYEPTRNALELVEMDRDGWEYANLIGIKPVALAAVQQRLSIDAAMAHSLAPGGAAVADHQLLLEENRVLRQQIIAGLLDREVSRLHSKLQESEADRAARLEIIQRLNDQIREKQDLITQVRQQLANSEADRAARLEVIQRLDTIARDQQAKIEHLSQNLLAANTEREAQRNHIQQLQTDLNKLQSELNSLTNRLVMKLKRKLKRSR